MKKLLLILSLFTISFSQAQKKLTIARVNYEGDWHYIDEKGEFLFPKTAIDACFSEGVIVVKKNNKYGFMNFKGELIIPYKYDFARCFQEGFAAVMFNGKMGIIDKKGKFIVKPQYELIGSFDHYGLAGVLHKGKVGFVDTTGKLVIPFKYEWHSSINLVPRYPFFGDGLIAVIAKNVEGESKVGFLNPKGELMIPAKYDNTFMLPVFFNGKATVFENKKAVLIDTLGNELAKLESNPGYNFAFDFRDGVALFYDGSKKLYGLINDQGKVILKPTYLNINPFKEGLAGVILKNEEGKVVHSYVSLEGKRAFENTFDYAKYFYEGVAAVEIKGKWGYVNKSGQMVIPAKFDHANDFRNGLAVVGMIKGDRINYGFIDKKGQFVISAIYEEAEDFALGLAPVKLGGKFGYINRKGKMIIKPKFVNVSSFYEQQVQK